MLRSTLLLYNRRRFCLDKANRKDASEKLHAEVKGKYQLRIGIEFMRLLR